MTHMFNASNFCKTCNKPLNSDNHSGLCMDCWRKEHYNPLQKKYRDAKKEKHICITCGKGVEPPKIEWPVRCLDCNKKQKKYREIRKQTEEQEEKRVIL